MAGLSRRGKDPKLVGDDGRGRSGGAGHTRRVLTSVELLTPDGLRLVVDADGWRLVTPRNYGERQRQAAETLVERAAELPMPAGSPEEPSWIERADHAIKALGLRVTHRHFRHG